MTSIAAMIRTTATAAGVLAVFAYGATAAEELPRYHLKSVGGASHMWQTTNVEIPWAATLGKDSNGRVTGEILPYNQVGFSGFEMLRMLQQGSIEYTRGDLSAHGGDNPRFEGIDQPGLEPTIDDARKAAEAYRPVLNPIFEKQWGAKLLMLMPNPPQVIWCNAPIKGVADLKGLKVRVYNKALAAFVEGAGGTPITMPSPEVVTSMQRGVINCAVTGSSNGNSGKWPEVSTHLLPLNMGWGMQYWAASLKTWNGLDAKVRTFLEKKFTELDAALWKAAREGGQQGIDCSVGKPCTFPGLTKYNMKLVEITPDDQKLARKIVQENVLKLWGQRCGAECVKEWNNTIGKAIGVTAPVPG